MPRVSLVVRVRPVTDDGMNEAVNRELIPAVKETLDEVNRLSGDAVEVTESSHNVLLSQRILLADASDAPGTLVLPAASAALGHWFTFKKTDSSSNAVTVSAADNIDGVTTRSLAVQYATLTVYCDGLTYYATKETSTSSRVAFATYTSGPVTVDDVIEAYLVDATTGAITVNLPTAVGRGGMVRHITKIDTTAYVVTVAAAAGETINTLATQSLSALGDSMPVLSDGANWWIQ